MEYKIKTEHIAPSFVFQLQLNDLRTHVTNVETEKVQLDEIIKTFDADITSKKVIH